MRNERGGVISKVFIIPAGVVVIIAVFLLGYYVGRGKGKGTASAEKPPALPEVVSQYIPKPEEYTFYRTLTEKGDKSVSVDLKLKTGGGDAAPRTPAEHPSAAKSEQKVPPLAKKETPQPRIPASATSKVRYTIQVSAYPDRSQAEDEVRNMKKRGYAAFVVATDLPDKGTWYRVRIGSFSKRESAEKLAAELKSKDGISTFITAE